VTERSGATGIYGASGRVPASLARLRETFLGAILTRMGASRLRGKALLAGWTREPPLAVVPEARIEQAVRLTLVTAELPVEEAR
jgi:hypothetical protein